MIADLTARGKEEEEGEDGKVRGEGGGVVGLERESGEEIWAYYGHN